MRTKEDEVVSIYTGNWEWSDAAKEDEDRLVSGLKDVIKGYPKKQRAIILENYIASIYRIIMDREAYFAILNGKKKSALNIVEENLYALHTKYGPYIFIEVKEGHIRVVRLIADTEPYIIRNEKLIEEGTVELR